MSMRFLLDLSLSRRLALNLVRNIIVKIVLLSVNNSVPVCTRARSTGIKQLCEITSRVRKAEQKWYVEWYSGLRSPTSIELRSRTLLSVRFSLSSPPIPYKGSELYET